MNAKLSIPVFISKLFGLATKDLQRLELSLGGWRGGCWVGWLGSDLGRMSEPPKFSGLKGLLGQKIATADA